MAGKRPIKYFLAAASAGILFGAEGLFILKVPGLNSLEITFFRYLFGTIALSAFIVIFKNKLRIRDKRILLFGGLANVFIVPLYIVSIQLGTALGNAAFLFDMGYIFSVLFSWMFLKEKISKRYAVAILIATIGAGFILKPSALLQNYAELLALLAGLIYGLQLVIFRKSEQTQNPITTSFASYVVPLIFLSPLLLVNFQMPTGMDFLYLIGFGLIGGALPVYLLITSLGRLKTFEAGVPALLEPLSAAALGFIVFGQVLDAFSMIGGILILAAIAYSSFREG